MSRISACRACGFVRHLDEDGFCERTSCVKKRVADVFLSAAEQVRQRVRPQHREELAEEAQ